MKVHVDEQLCTGHAMCHLSGPDVYVLDDEGFNRTPDQEVAPGLEVQARRGAEACPEQAILIIEDGTA